MEEIPHNIWLVPSNADEKKRFAEFRQNDMTVLFTQVCMINASFGAGTAVMCFISPTVENFNLALLAFILICLYGVVWMLRKRLKNNLMFVITGLYVLA